MPPEAQLRLAALLFSSRPYERNRLPSASTPSPLCLAGGTQGSAQDAAWQGDVEGLVKTWPGISSGLLGPAQGFSAQLWVQLSTLLPLSEVPSCSLFAP